MMCILILVINYAVIIFTSVLDGSRECYWLVSAIIVWMGR